MNSYFASVEQQANIFLRGKPVGVCAYLSPKGAIIASSKEVKLRGVKTAERVPRAQVLCPEIVLVQNDPPKYRSVTRKLFSLLAEYSTDVEPYSIDEAFIDLTAYLKVGQRSFYSDFESAQAVGKEINQRIKSEIGEWLTSSIGISRTMFLAKLLSDTGPKDTVTMRDVSEIPEYIKDLVLTDIWGINKRFEMRLNRIGIFTPTDFYRASQHQIMQSLHKPGFYLWAGLRGLNIQSARRPKEPKSIGHSYCLPKKTTDKAYLSKMLMKLCERTGRRMREKQFEARHIYIYWRYARGGGAGYSRRLPVAIYDSWDIFRYSWQYIDHSDLSDAIAMLAVSVSNFSPSSDQMNLFASECVREGRKRKLNAALDALNSKHGEFTVIRGAMWGTKENAPDRIGFRKTVSWEE